MVRLTLCALLLAGCPSGLWLQAAGHPLNSRQDCLAEPALRPAAELAWSVLSREAASAGYDASRLARVRPGVCLLARPEPCCQGSSCQVDTDGVLRDKAGCTVGGLSMWVSREWPTGTVYDWRPTLLHELGHIAGFAVDAEQRRDHQGAWAEVEVKAQAAFRAALGAP